MDFSKTDSILSQAIGSVTPAAQMVVLYHGAWVHDIALGWLDPENRTRPANPETLFDLASVTKLYTTTAFMTLVEQGKVMLDTPVCTILPEFDEPRPIQPYEDPLDWGKFVTV